jgi:multidrug efflux pump subunit AcrB
MPKELFPDIVLPTVLVQTVYPGNPPIDIENLITRPIEKEVETIKGVKKVSSTSAQNASMVTIEFNFDINVKDAVLDVKDAVDKAKADLPRDLPRDPLVMDIDFSEMPFIFINLSGDYSIDELRKFGELLEEDLEKIKEVSKVNIMGVTEKEVEINVDMLKLSTRKISFYDIFSAIGDENISMSGGEIIDGGVRRSIRVVGEFTTIDEIKNIIVKHEKGNIVYLKDVANVEFKFQDPKSFARLNEKPVISLQVVKKGGENILSATEQVKESVKKLKKENTLPEDLNYEFTNDQSDMVKKQLSNLENSMIMSVLFVVMVLFFFLGTRNALFVGIAIPLSMFLSFIVLTLIDYQVNMIVLFALILALGMLVDNAIVVVENIYRFITQGYPNDEAAKRAVGEIATAIIASTATTLAAFFPLAFWDSMMGEFMKYLPITLIIVLTSSLFVALIIIPVISSVFSTIEENEKQISKKRGFIITGILFGLSAIIFAAGSNTLGNIFGIAATVTLLNLLIFKKVGVWFQEVLLIKLENGYLKFLNIALKGKKPIILFVGCIILMFVTIGFYFGSKPQVELFPEGDPQLTNIMAELPTGSDINVTDSLMYEMEEYIRTIINPYLPHFNNKGIDTNKTTVVKSILTNIGEGAKIDGDMSSLGEAENPHKGLITINYIDFELRGGVRTNTIQKLLEDSLIGKYAGVTLTIEKDRNGPPTGKPINIEVSGNEFKELIIVSDEIMSIINNEKIEGIEELKKNLQTDNPEIIITVNRESARRFGLSTKKVAETIRFALFGWELSDYKVGEDEYPIQLRLDKKYRYNINSLMNQIITFRNNMGRIVQIPISSVAHLEYGSTFGSVRRINQKRTITVYSNVTEGNNANEINVALKELLSDYEYEGIDVKFTGEQEDMAESMSFLGTAFGIAVLLIFVIMIMQFNSIAKPFIIISSVGLSTIGVFGGLASFDMPFIVVMTGIGIVSLAGVVVNNAIVLIDYIDLLKNSKRKELKLPEKSKLSMEDNIECIVQGGKTRLRPVLLTAITTILGLFPMAIGMNINFSTFLSDFDPQLTFGGDMATMWSPMSLTVIFGLTFATFLTLVIVPVMYKIGIQIKYAFVKK